MLKAAVCGCIERTSSADLTKYRSWMSYRNATNILLPLLKGPVSRWVEIDHGVQKGKIQLSVGTNSGTFTTVNNMPGMRNH